MSVCKLCSKYCKLYDSSVRNGFFTKKCSFVQYLEFDESTFKKVSGSHPKMIPALFSDVIKHQKNDKILYVDMKLDSLADKSLDGLLLSSSLDLSKQMITEYPERLNVEIKNLVYFYRDGSFSTRSVDIELLHALQLVSKKDFFKAVEELKKLCAFEYLRTDDGINYFITEKGYDASKAGNTKTKSAFIALSYKPDNNQTIDTIKKCIKDSGFNPVVMRDLQHNNYIMPEMLEQIKESRFLVCDLSIPNYGAYFESGYAMGLSHDVIITCNKATFDDKENSPHFDIKQFNVIIWDDYSDLESKLKLRIEKTIH